MQKNSTYPRVIYLHNNFVAFSKNINKTTTAVPLLFDDKQRKQAGTLNCVVHHLIFL